MSLAALVVSAIDSFYKTDVFKLAGTQWILIAIILAIYALMASGCNCDYCKNKNEGQA